MDEKDIYSLITKYLKEYDYIDKYRIEYEILKDIRNDLEEHKQLFKKIFNTICKHLEWKFIYLLHGHDCKPSHYKDEENIECVKCGFIQPVMKAIENQKLIKDIKPNGYVKGVDE